MKIRAFGVLAAAVGVVFGSVLCGTASADTILNYDPELPAPAPILDAGWTSDAISAAFADSSDSPYAYNLAGNAYFRITDQFVVGDTYYVYDFGNLILTTSLAKTTVHPGAFGDDATADAGWTDGRYQSGEVLLGAGAHLLTVQGDGAGGLPAGFYTRLDSTTVPLPGADLMGLSVLGGIGFFAFRRRRTATVA